MPEQEWEHFEDHWAFDESWRDWLDNPPVGWRPPEKTPLFWRVVDNLDKGGWAVRLDAWIGAEGIHMHFRWIVLLEIPDRDELESWVRGGRLHSEFPQPVWSFTRKGVAGFVVPWSQIGMMKDILVDPDKSDDNGKGEDLNDFDKREL